MANDRATTSHAADSSPVSGCHHIPLISRLRLPWGEGVRLLAANGYQVVLIPCEGGLDAFLPTLTGEQYVGRVVGASLAMPNQTLYRAVFITGGKL